MTNSSLRTLGSSSSWSVAIRGRCFYVDPTHRCSPNGGKRTCRHSSPPRIQACMPKTRKTDRSRDHGLWAPKPPLLQSMSSSPFVKVAADFVWIRLPGRVDCGKHCRWHCALTWSGDHLWSNLSHWAASSGFIPVCINCFHDMQSTPYISQASRRCLRCYCSSHLHLGHSQLL